TVTANAQTRYYGEANPVFSQTLSGFVNGQNLATSAVSGSDVGSVTATASSAVNTYTITASAAGYSANNYRFTAVDGVLTVAARPITITANAGQTKVYGNADATFAYTVEANSSNRGLVGSDTFSGALARATGEDVGDYTINQGSLANGNYAITYQANDYSITQRPISLTADAASKVYGEADPTLGVTISAGSLATVAVTDSLADVTGSLSRSSGNNVGSYDLALGSGSKAANYAITFNAANQAFSISARPIYVTADAGQTKVYGEADPILTYATAAKTTGSGLMGTDGVTLTGALARAIGTDVGTTYAINQGSLATSAGSNYSIQYTAANFAITARPIYVTADAGQSKIYGETDPTFTYATAAKTTGSGLMGSDGVTLSGTLARASGSDVGTTYAINQGDLTSGSSNYSIQYTGANFAITARPIYITADAGQSKIYGETDPTFT
ncbi:hypothetical protein JZU69_04880, partial [bacterium]|nr:hypothetical protein [bacterium]